VLPNSLTSTLPTSTEIFIDWKVPSRKHKPDEAASPVSLLFPCREITAQASVRTAEYMPEGATHNNTSVRSQVLNFVEYW
jgi:hypothetical protein